MTEVTNMKRFIMILVFVFAAAMAFAVQPDFTGSFEFEFRAPTDSVLFGHGSPQGVDDLGFAYISTDMDFKVDDNNLIHTSMSAYSNDVIKLGDAYLQTAWGFMTTKLGNTGYDSFDYGLSNKAYETFTGSISGKGIYAEVPLGIFTLAGSKLIDPCIGGFGIKYSNGAIEGIGISWIIDVEKDVPTKHALTASGKIVAGDISAGAGLKWDDGDFSYGAGIKASLSPTWIAIGAGISDGDLKLGADTGLAYDTWGIDLILSHVEKINAVTLDAWKKIGAVTFKTGYDYKADADDEIFAKITASF